MPLDLKAEVFHAMSLLTLQQCPLLYNLYCLLFLNKINLIYYETLCIEVDISKY